MANATQRVSNALAVLRNELDEMRNQDVQLMKQLLNLNSSIQQLSKRNDHSKRVRATNKRRRPMLSQVFEPPQLNKIDEDANISSDSDDDCNDKGLFRTNVKLWKYSQSSDSDSD